DLLQAMQNRGVSTRVRPLAITVGLDPASDPDGDGMVAGPEVTVVGRTAPGAWVRLDQGGDGTFEQTVTADAAGLFRIPAVVGLGTSSILVEAMDRFGQRSRAGLAVMRPSDSLPPPVTILSPQPGRLTNTNVELTGRVADDASGSGVAALQARVDDGPFVVVPFDVSGNFRVTTTLALGGAADGPHVVRLRATDRAGNTSAPVEI